MTPGTSGNKAIIIGKKSTMQIKSFENWRQDKRGTYKIAPGRSEEGRAINRVGLP
jgi:hypothetical protein